MRQKKKCNREQPKQQLIKNKPWVNFFKWGPQKKKKKKNVDELAIEIQAPNLVFKLYVSSCQVITGISVAFNFHACSISPVAS